MSQVETGAGLGATEPRHTHKLTPLVTGARFLPFALFAGFITIGQNSAGEGLFVALAITIGVVVLIALLIAGFAYVSWRRLTFWFDDQGDLRVASGVLTRTERRLQLSRLQGVDVVQPFIPRLFGLAQVTVEVAGTGDSRVNTSEMRTPRTCVTPLSPGLLACIPMRGKRRNKHWWRSLPRTCWYRCYCAVSPSCCSWRRC